MKKLQLLIIVAMTMAAGIVSAADYLVDFSSSSDLTDRFELLDESFTGIWSDGSKLNFDRDGPGGEWSSYEPNLYGFRDTPGSEVLRFDGGVVSIDSYLDYNSSIRNMMIGAGFFLYDPDKSSGELGAWDNPYVYGKMDKVGKHTPDFENRFVLDVAGGDIGSQDSGWTHSDIIGDSWVANTLTFTESLTGGYDISWVNAGTGTHTFTDHTDQDLSNVAIGLHINYREFMNASGGSNEAYMDNFTINTTVVPEPISAILFVTGGTLLAGRRLTRKKRT